ncbi:tetratricopeptide repeat protein [Solimonas terrae]|uniref:Tetratricopeptide repeat protein n=1 Tax=Solimonas terrae TaxID=1396819 RepID=A0A6M2BXR3_9GAMM|nr:tetratricopeptide repeat protein [Solimonas terrae]NGY06971.1 tetratricopeptide repeat protein [Solimonas terrae]
MAVTLATVWLVYAPGLHGAFLFDDFANLPAIGATGPVDNWPAFWRYITSGTADPTGRPLTLLSFLLDARDWPADPFAFKRTNLLLHMLNGVLLWHLLRQLGFLLAKPSPPTAAQRVEMAAVFGTALWLLHPLFVSTTLYVVQREAMLPATCVMLGLLAWLHGRTHFAAARPGPGLAWILVGIGAGTCFGVLSKANGALLPVYVLLLERSILRAAQPLPSPIQARYYRWLGLLAGLPTIALLAYLGWEGYRGIASGIGTLRPWTLTQRLLTEPRVVLEYLRLLLLPQPFTTGLFNDQIAASRSLLSPPGTALSILIVSGLLAFACFARKRYPIVAAALLFFFAGQLLESTTIPLELYYEHRNYIPAVLLFWPLAWWICGLELRAPSGMSLASPGAFARVRLPLAVAILAGLTLMTHARSSLWGNVRDQAILWAQMNPASPRAQANAAQIEMSAGMPDRAQARLLRALAAHPDETQLALNLIAARCMLGGADSGSLHSAENALRTAREGGTLLVGWFERMIINAAEDSCPGLDLHEADRLISAAFANPFTANQPGRLQDLHYLRGSLAIKRKDGDAALAEFDRALALQVRSGAAMRYAALLGSAGYPKLGLEHLDYYATIKERAYQPGWGMPRLHELVLQKQQYTDNELSHLRTVLEQDEHDAKRQD